MFDVGFEFEAEAECPLNFAYIGSTVFVFINYKWSKHKGILTMFLISSITLVVCTYPTSLVLTLFSSLKPLGMRNTLTPAGKQKSLSVSLLSLMIEME